MGRLRCARYVQHQRNAGWPKGREPYGHGVLVVVGGGESPLQGEGGQAGRRLKGEGSEMDDYLSRVDVAPPESCLRSKDSRAVRRGAVGKVPVRVTRRPPTLPHVRFLGAGDRRLSPATRGWGKPTTWRRETGGLTTETFRYARCETPKRSWELSANVADEGCRWRTSIVHCSTAPYSCVPMGESTAMTVR